MVHDKPTSPVCPDEDDPNNWRPFKPGMTPAIPIVSNQIPTPTQLYPYHQQGFTHSPPRTNPPPTNSPLPRQYRSMSNLTDPPPLPPKPIAYPTMDTDTSHGDSYSPPSLPPPPLPSPPPLSSPPLLPSPPPLPSPPAPLVPPQDEVIVPTEDSDELAMVLALSQSESVQKKLLEEQLMNQEEEDLARALAASMLPSESYFPSPTNKNPESNNALDAPWIHSSPSHKPLASPPISLPVTPGGPSEESSHPSILHDPYVEFGRYDKWRIPNRPEKQPEEAPKLEPQPSPGPSSVSLLPYASAIEVDKSSSQHGDADESSDFSSSETVLKLDNAAYARQPVSDEEKVLNQSLYNEEGQQNGSVDQAKSSSTSYGKQNAEGPRPPSARVASHEELYGRQYPHDTRVPTDIATPSMSVPTYSPVAPNALSQPPAPDYSFPSIGKANSYQPDVYQEKRKQSLPFSPIAYPSLGSRRGSASDVHSETSQKSQTSSPPIPHIIDKLNLHLDMPQRPATSETRRHATLPAQPIATTSATTLNQRPLTAGLLNVNHFVDRDLLCGVSIGFKSPIISTRLAPMQEQMPNIISLPYTRCPPLHIQAPDWRHLLRLMARLSGTRIEPTVEATTVSKVELKLRTVIQFIKPHSSSDWRSVLWFTIEQPAPSSDASASRYTTGNPNLLPYSYTLSPIPALLRDASDTNMSKTYTIPATDTIPLPTLPITFPDLALYLQAALDTSRRHLSDSPNGLGKLGKMVQICYPNVNQDNSEYQPERTKVGQYIKRVIGLSNKDKKKVKGTNNEDTYQLVTPFIPNEWG